MASNGWYWLFLHDMPSISTKHSKFHLYHNKMNNHCRNASILALHGMTLGTNLPDECLLKFPVTTLTQTCKICLKRCRICPNTVYSDLFSAMTFSIASSTSSYFIGFNIMWTGPFQTITENTLSSDICMDNQSANQNNHVPKAIIVSTRDNLVTASVTLDLWWSNITYRSLYNIMPTNRFTSLESA